MVSSVDEFMNEDFECIQVFIEGINAKGIEPMSYLIEIICHARNRTDELHLFGFDACLDFCFCNEPSQKLGASDGCLARFTQQGVVFHGVEPKKHLVFSSL